MQLTIESVGPSKTGKSLRVKANGDWYGAKLDSGIKQGATIEATIIDGDYGPQIREWREASTPAGKTNGAPSTNWWMPFVSNTVAHAIQAGLIKEPKEVGPWAVAAMQTAIALEEVE